MSCNCLDLEWAMADFCSRAGATFNRHFLGLLEVDKMQSGKACARGSRLVLLAVVLLSTTAANAAFIGLGEAGQYSMFVVSNTQWAMNNSVIAGPMAAGPGVTYNWSGGSGP